MALCSECGMSQATILIKSVIGGKVYEKMICASCMEKKKKALQEGLSVSDLMAGFLKDMEDAPKEQLRCPQCGLTCEEFRKGGRLGCASCYATFEEQLTPMLSRIHGKVRHAGRRPKAFAQREDTRGKVESLKAELEAAVKIEDFEHAAVLRDQIKELQGEGNENA